MNRSPLFSRLAAVGTLAVVTLLASCSTPAPVVRADFDHSANFGRYRTFGFPESTGTDRGGYATLATTHFKDAVRREMTARGYTYAEASPDLIVNFFSELRDKTEVYSYPGVYPYFGAFGFHGHPHFGYWGGWGGWPYYSDINVVQYTSGALKLDVVDAAQKQVVWEARVEDKLSEEAQDNPQLMIDRLVAEMFKKFPIGGGTPK